MELNASLRIGCSEWINPYDEIYESIVEFQQNHKDLRLSFRIFPNDDLLEQLKNVTIDIALFVDSQLPVCRDFEVIPICQEELCIMGPKSIVHTELSKVNHKNIGTCHYYCTNYTKKGMRKGDILISTAEIGSYALI